MLDCWLLGVVWSFWGQKWGPKTVKNGPRVWAFCKIEFPGIQKPVQILAQKSAFFENPGNRGVGVIWSSVGRVGLILLYRLGLVVAFYFYWLVVLCWMWCLVA